MDQRNLRSTICDAISVHASEIGAVRFLPINRYDRSIFSSTGQYDWFSGQVLFCLVRHLKPLQIVEISCSSGYSSLFMATALKANGRGKLETFELSEKNAESALANFKRFGVKDCVQLHLGDARKTICEIDSPRTDILFIDSLHTRDFAHWFLENLVSKLTPEALVHVHDIMPRDARVRLANGPPFPGDSVIGRIRRATHWLLRMHLDEYAPIPKEAVKLPQNGENLPSYDGNHFTEAVFINSLVENMPAESYAYLHHLAKEEQLLEVRTYDALAVGRKDSQNRPMEWNESLWTSAGSLSDAYHRQRKP